ncbi:MAG TPA: HNH endonuclease signature motif containing protein [bacterium]|nr:HNH endonuclease signature motif containing protein [bacterium]
MNYFYRCPDCRKGISVEWRTRREEIPCPHCKKRHVPPTPREQLEAYVDQREWPQEMEDTVRALKGDLCTVPGCTNHADTLDHRVPWGERGKTSVWNLYPMCREHNESKGDRDYYEWVAEQI